MSVFKQLLSDYKHALLYGHFYDAGVAYLAVVTEYEGLQSRLEELNQEVEGLEKENASLKKDATRYQDFKANSHIHFSLFSGRYRADNGHSILTDWLESFDECFDTAMQASKQ